MPSAQELVAHVTALTSLPSVYFRVREVLESPDSSVSDVAQALSNEPALTARLLRLVNSALYGFPGRIETVSRAVTVLGLQQVHDLVLAASIGSIFAGLHPERMDVARFWRGCVLCALAARQAARSCGVPGAERLFVIGLLADLGHLVMYQTVPSLAAEAQARADADGEPLDRAERRIVGCDHAELAAALMEHWRLPAPFVEIAAAQVNPRLAGGSAFEAAIVHVATRIVRADRVGETSRAAAGQIDPVVWSLLALQPEESFARIREEAELDLAGCVSLFFPDLPAR